MRANDADAGGRKALQAFGKQRQAAKPARDRLFAEHGVFIQTIGQMNPLFKAADDLHCPVDDTGDHHMKTV
ncbi:hypothetical protein RTE01_28540 [Raoultella terrigena]|nr:hypothetical protein RTE01_28540 [Raoultella terrigena]